MRLDDLKESLPGKPGKTTKADAEAWVERCKNDFANLDAKDKELFTKLQKVYDQLMALSKELGGESTVKYVFTHLLNKK